MNKSYRVVWNASTGTWDVVSELAKERQKSSSRRVMRTVLAFGVAVGGMALAGSASAYVAGRGAEDLSGFGTAVGDGALARGCELGGASSPLANTYRCNTAVGTNAYADKGSVALGDASTATGVYSTALGSGALATEKGATALGGYSSATGTSSTALGYSASASSSNSVAIGESANATATNSVALGSKSTTTANLAAAGYNPGSGTLSGAASTTNGEVSVGASGKERRVTNVAAGGADTDAVNVSQLKSEATKSNAIGANTASALGGGSTYNATTGAITGTTYNVAGEVQHDVGSALAALNSATVQFNGTGGAADVKNKKIENVAAGTLSSASTDAMNGSQLYATNQDVAKNAGDISTIDTQVTNIDGRVSTVEDSLTTINQSMGGFSGQLADAVKYDSSSHDSVTLGGTGADPVALRNVAAGVADMDAVNVAQLKGVDSRVSGIDGRVTTVESDITTIHNNLNNGSVGMVQQAAAGETLTVGKNTDGQAVNFAGTAGNRVLSGVAAGEADSDAVNVAQLKSAGLLGAGGVVMDAVVYDAGSNRSQVTLGGFGMSGDPVILTNVADGKGQYDAVNYGQFSQLKDQVSSIDSRVTNVEGLGGNNGSNGGISDNQVASASDAAATGSGSVALGSGSVADRANSVSVGATGGERQITNVAAGTATTDAVNVGQLNQSVADVKADTTRQVSDLSNSVDQRFNDTNRAIGQVAKNAYAGVAAAMAMPNMTPSGPGKTVVAAGVANYKSGSAVAVGGTYRTRDSKWLVNTAISGTSTGDVGVRAQIGYEF
ncbi:Autotransporter adhesin [Burkholderia sp. GAS332]|nr:Autotransporter adhesin [Burkholderia sp. GAS332]